MIGNDLINRYEGTNQIPLSLDLRAKETVFGWVIHGVKDGQDGQMDLTQHSVSTAIVSWCRLQTSNLWELEGLGIRAEPDLPDIVPKPQWNEKEKRIEVGLLWAGDSRPVPNFSAAARRDKTVLSQASNLRQEQYGEFMNKNFKEGVIRYSPSEWMKLLQQFFLPYHAVQGGKFIVVFDGSALDGKGKPFNSYLVAGPNLLPKLLKVLVRFRTKPVGLQADIQGAFHQIVLPECDRPFVQFVYNGKVLHFQRVPFGLICSPSMFHAAVDFLLSRVDCQDTAAHLKDGLYFDDMACGFDSLDEAVTHSKVGVDIFAESGMLLHKIRMTGDEKPPSKLLGLLWDTKEDFLSVRINLPTVVKTKRDLLSTVSKIWDPLGVLSPWSIRGRYLFQETWKSKETDWKNQLPQSISDQLRDWLAEASDTQSIAFPRICIVRPTSLDCFVDASEKACCACVYLVNDSGERHLLAAKTRLAPISKPLSIPRLELIAAIMGARLVSFIGESLSNSLPDLQRRFFSDSQIVLYWLQCRSPLKLFVSNRVREILSTTTIHQWFYVPTTDNPADLGTRGVRLSDLPGSNLWWRGPNSTFSLEPFVVTNPPQSALVEVKAIQNLVIAPADIPVVSRMFELKDVGKLSSAIYRTAWVYRFIRNSRLRAVDGLQGTTGRQITPEEYQFAKEYWIRIAQKEDPLLSDIFDGNIPRSLRALKPFVRNDLIYCSPRTVEPSVLLLPKEARITELIIHDAHKKMFHQGATATSSILQGEYHIARKTIKQALSACRACKRYRSMAFQGPEGPMPETRTTYTRCFARIGADFFGPIYTSENVKAYCLLITCYSSRAIHLEAVESQSVEDTTLAIRRFVALRGVPMEIRTDNAKTFRAMSRTLSPSIQWKFIPERSPWWGGFYERLVGVVKRSLRVSLHRRTIDFRTLQVILYEVAYFINLRPLTTYQDNILCPALFLYAVPSTSRLIHPEVFDSIDKHWRSHSAALLELRRRFYREYLPTLRRWRNPNRVVRTPAVGDVVLVYDVLPRAQWKMARVERLLYGPDGHCRAAEIFVNGKTTRRALERLYALESGSGIPQTECPLPGESTITTDPGRPTSPVAARPSPLQIPVDDTATDDAVATPSSARGRDAVTRRGRRVVLPSRYRD